MTYFELNFDLIMFWVLTAGSAWFIWLLFEAHNAPDRFDLRDLVMDNNRVSLTKTSQTGAFLVSTWAFVYLVLNSRLTEWYFAGYMAVWVGNRSLMAWINKGKFNVDGKEGDAVPNRVENCNSCYDASCPNRKPSSGV